MTDSVKSRKVWHPAPYERGDIQALHSLAQYAQLAEIAWDEATMGAPPPCPSPFEVKRALDWIIYSAAQTYDDPFVLGHADASSYVMGRQSVGRQIIKLMKLKSAVFDKERT